MIDEQGTNQPKNDKVPIKQDKGILYTIAWILAMPALAILLFTFMSLWENSKTVAVLAVASVADLLYIASEYE